MATLEYQPQASLLKLPEEIRRIIYTYLFRSESNIKVDYSHDQVLHVDKFGDLLSNPFPSTDEVFTMETCCHPLSSQLLRTNKQVFAEARPLLYSLNAFDCSARDGVLLLAASISRECWSNMTSLVLDWHQLLDFSFKLAKPEFVERTRNLTSITLGYWRMRILGGSSALWMSAKSNESTIIRAATAICEKSAKLRVVAQHQWHSKQRPVTGNGTVGQDQWACKPRRILSSSRVKWRLLASEAQMSADETKIVLGDELALLQSKGEDDEAERTMKQRGR